MDQDKRNKIEVGDMVVHKANNADKKYPCKVLAMHGASMWIEYEDGYLSTTEVSKYKKVPDIRTISCAGGAIKVTGEFVRQRNSTGLTLVEIKKSWNDMYLFWGKDITDTP